MNHTAPHPPPLLARLNPTCTHTPLVILSETAMGMCARAHRLLLEQGRRRSSRQQQQRLIYSIDGVFDSHLKEDTVLRVEQHWRPLITSLIPKVGTHMHLTDSC